MIRVCNLYSLHCHQWHRDHSLVSVPGPKNQAKDNERQKVSRDQTGKIRSGTGFRGSCTTVPVSQVPRVMSAFMVNLNSHLSTCVQVCYIPTWPHTENISGKGTAMRIRWTKQWPIRAAAQGRQKYSVLTHKECVVFTSLGLLIYKNEKLGQLLIFSGA